MRVCAARAREQWSAAAPLTDRAAVSGPSAERSAPPVIRPCACGPPVSAAMAARTLRPLMSLLLVTLVDVVFLFGVTSGVKNYVVHWNTTNPM